MGCSPEHLFYFSPKTITDLLKRSGFISLVIESAPKYLNIIYIINQFRIYQQPLFTPVLKILDLLIPNMLKKIDLPVYCGQMLVLARKFSA